MIKKGAKNRTALILHRKMYSCIKCDTQILLNAMKLDTPPIVNYNHNDYAKHQKLCMDYAYQDLIEIFRVIPIA